MISVIIGGSASFVIVVAALVAVCREAGKPKSTHPFQWRQ